jgi:hypothetical protein
MSHMPHGLGPTYKLTFWTFVVNKVEGTLAGCNFMDNDGKGVDITLL